MTYGSSSHSYHTYNLGRYCDCGRKALAFFPHRRTYGADHAHQLCQQCWRAERDRTRVTLHEGEIKYV